MASVPYGQPAFCARTDKRSHCRADAGEHPSKKSQWGTLNQKRVPHETRDQVVDYINKWTEKTKLTQTQLLRWAGIWPTTFSKWKQFYGKESEHNGWIPRDHWLEPWERDAIISFYHANPLHGYRRLTYIKSYRCHP